MKLFIDDPFNSRFGTLPDWAKRKLDSASPEQLEQWADCVLVLGDVRENMRFLQKWGQVNNA